jgi:antitoxin CcdA
MFAALRARMYDVRHLGTGLSDMLDRPPRNGKRTRQPVNLSLPTDLVDDANALGLDLSQLVEAKLGEAVRAEKMRRWRDENRAAIEAQNEFHRQHGFWAEDIRPW